MFSPPIGSPAAFASACRDEASLNVIIPMGGAFSEAFRTAGYSAPKPMIKIAGRPMLLHLLDQLKLRLGDVVWLIIPSDVYLQFQSQLDFKSEYPQADIRVCQFTVQTRGAAETIFIGLQQMSTSELSRRTLCLDCDTLYFSDVLSMLRAAPDGKGMCAYFIDTGTAALYSYLRLDESDGAVMEVREKDAISDLANIGAYGFASATLLRQFIQVFMQQQASSTATAAQHSTAQPQPHHNASLSLSLSHAPFLPSSLFLFLHSRCSTPPRAAATISTSPTSSTE